MGTIIFIITVVIEAVFITTCILTKSNQDRLKSFVRVGALAAFVLFALASVIQWGFRWYFLGFLLFVWAALGARALLAKRVEKKEYQPGRSVLKAIGTLVLVGIVVTPALIFPQFKLPPTTGPYPVATVNYTYTDANRIETFTNTGENRKVNVEFWYPQDATGTYPLVVFSHGAFGMKASNTSTFMELASNGYVVCSIDHPYHSLFTVDSDRQFVKVDSAFMQEVLDANNGKYDEQGNYELTLKWLKVRTLDMNFVLDTILARVADSGSDPVYQLIDPEKIGLMGHSLGGAASAQVARERADSNRADSNRADRDAGNVDAVINLDADLLGDYLAYVSDGKYVMNEEVYPVPLLTIFADDMLNLMAAIENPNEVIAVKHVIATSPNAYEIDLAGTNHMSLTDLPLVSPWMVSVINSSVPKGGGVELDKYGTIEKMNGIVLDFFNDTLKGAGSFSVPATD